jgi:hypothetical protein
MGETGCSCGLWAAWNRLCLYYMALCYMAGRKDWANAFHLGQWIAGNMAMGHLKITVGA